MRFTSWSGALTVAAVVLAACQKAETPDQAASRMRTETETARPAITEVSARWARYASANQPDSIVELYTPDGVMLPPDVPGATGRDSMRARLATLLAPGAVLTITTASVTANGPLAVERGNWTYAIPAQGKTPAITLDRQVPQSLPQRERSVAHRREHLEPRHAAAAAAPGRAPGPLTVARPFITAVALLCGLAGCGAPAKTPAAAPADPAAIRNEIQAREREWSAAFLAGNAAGIAALYTEDGAQVQAAGDPHQGRAAITAAMQAQFDTVAVTAREDIADEVIPAGDFAVEIGHYSFQGTSKAGHRPVSGAGHYMVLWRKDADGVWRLHRDIGNDAPRKP